MIFDIIAGTSDTSGGIVPWTPAGLFVSGEPGAWYDPSDMSTMFQDAAGTTPVTASGQSVGRILDKTGNNNHAVQPISGLRPTLQNDGLYNYLSFDGVDDFLESTSLITPNPTTTFIGFLVATGKTTQGTLLDGRVSRQLIEYNVGSPGTFVIYAGGGESSGGATFLNNQQVVSTSIFNGASSRIRINSVDFSAFNAGSDGLNGAIIGEGNAALFRHEGRIYQTIILGRLATSQEITDTETYVGSKQ